MFLKSVILFLCKFNYYKYLKLNLSILYILLLLKFKY